MRHDQRRPTVSRRTRMWTLPVALYFSFPYRCSADLNSPAPPLHDQKVKLSVMKETKIKADVLQKEKVYKCEQAVEPCYFDFRQIVEEDEEERLEKEDEDSDEELADYFKGKAGP